MNIIADTTGKIQMLLGLQRQQVFFFSFSFSFSFSFLFFFIFILTPSFSSENTLPQFFISNKQKKNMKMH